MKKIAIIFPHQLFEDHPALSLNKDIYLVEDGRFFTDFKFHKKKLLFHRESMFAYKKELTSKGYHVSYLQQDVTNIDSNLVKIMSNKKLEDVYIAGLCDHKLTRRLKRICKQHQKRLNILESPAFLTSKQFLKEFFTGRKNLSMSSFYIKQRKKLDILIIDGKPVGGKWSYDPENRKKLPQDIHISKPKKAIISPSKLSVSKIEVDYKKNPGQIDNFIFPLTRKDARQWLKVFVTNRLKYFGDYEDSISKRNVFIFHSVLSPLINSGLLTPKEVIDYVLRTADRNDIPINSLEGFVRQIIGWREFIRGAYLFTGDKQRKSNFWNCSNRLPKAFYDGTTGIEPVDTIIRRVLNYSYCHHIERLMILGNFMLLCEIHPNEVYRWFMELFIDAYDWVMVPNVYGMSQYADGGLITSKPYISSSNYIKKMSDFEAGSWCHVWDALFWRFIEKHRKVFAENPRMRVMTFQLNRMGTKKVKEQVQIAEKFLQGLFR
ncbi:MAG: cryptochrome/photolyase family protein [Phycisphaerae bacterium]|nr:cryptochrome/photolyase family protein [Phycisphaerae bacterium]NIV10859.1 cryptochrome/photolyase family protein [Fodinibius sp.]NIP55155.1 cryptochrome/photolyase family protein [Phycisphaerae bacterium]NIS53369.1 cryptochrome/photolyase family protein [Phycisphaerae bacterium]NIU58689.1 cryptochrome/photolyase family protein [Phycisphaerae bacterium]